jgi:hypothetical protein
MQPKRQPGGQVASSPSYDAKGSSFFRGQISRFTLALKYLEEQDTVAAAHWCDNGDTRLDLAADEQR